MKKIASGLAAVVLMLFMSASAPAARNCCDGSSCCNGTTCCSGGHKK